MADEYDYTQMWSGVYTPRRIDDDSVFILEEKPKKEKFSSDRAELENVMWDKRPKQVSLFPNLVPEKFSAQSNSTNQSRKYSQSDIMIIILCVIIITLIISTKKERVVMVVLNPSMQTSSIH